MFWACSRRACPEDDGFACGAREGGLSKLRHEKGKKSQARDDKGKACRRSRVCDGVEVLSCLCPCGYVTSVHEVWVAGIPGLKRETWGTLRVFPLILVGVVGVNFRMCQQCPQEIRGAAFGGPAFTRSKHSSRKAVILSEALRRTIASRRAYGVQSKSLS
jgi:hypothetical protein